MRILILSSKLPYPPKDGGALATLNLALGMAKSGMDVMMLAINTKKHYYDPERIPDRIKSAITLRTVYRDTSIRPLKALMNFLFSRTPYIAERYFFKEYQLELVHVLQQNKFDIVQLEGPYLFQYLKTIRLNSNAKISLRAHNVEHKIWEQRSKNESVFLKQMYLRNMAERIKKLEITTLNQVQLLVSISKEDEKYFQTITPGITSTTIPAGIDISAYELTPNLPKNSIFFLGSLDWMPNQEGLLWFKREVLPELLAYNNNIHFHVAGRNAPENFLSELDHPNIVFHGEVEDAIAFMNKYNIMAVPLLTGSGIRIKIIEGMALGKCIVTTSLGAEGLNANDGEELFIANHGKLFAEKLIILLENQQRAQEMSSVSRKFILENFDTFALASNLRDQYKRIV